MRIRRKETKIQEGDLTPMIDMTFQLIAFFMVLINFTQTEQLEGIYLPTAALAKPPEGPMETPITLHVDRQGLVTIGGQQVDLNGLVPHLINEVNVLVIRKKSPSDATIIIRADRRVPAGKVQDVIRVCQENRFDRFVLRVLQSTD
ncbi:MAG: biopolymer transporter ExbD [Pirellulaceae bacterium]|nr:MAG: biopolymer transporter ExbD [Pirellulaceae bacterium]